MMQLDDPIEVHVVHREWPKRGDSLYSVTNEPDDIHMSWVRLPKRKDGVAILMSINPKTQTITVLKLQKCADEEAGIKWYIEERHRRRLQ